MTAPAIDAARALERVLGDRALLERVLARFRDEYRDAAGAIGRAMAGGQQEQARRLAHTLKGAAAMIEASALHRQALALETALRDGSGDSAAELARLDSELERVMRALDAALGAGANRVSG